MTGLTRSQILVGAAGVALPARRRAPGPLAALAAAMRGPVLLPGTTAYNRITPVFNGRYAGVRPAAVAQPLDARDLAAALQVARARDLSIRIRAGGHSYIGASTVARGVVLDLRRLRGIKLMADGSVLAGAGLRQIELITALARRGRAVVHGSCPAVGVAGFTLGGGYGFDARRYGMACDTLLAAHVVDLRTLRPALADAELLHGLRGAGASLAPVTSLRLRTHAVGTVTTFFASYPWSRAAEVVRAFSARCASAPAPLASICSLSTGSGSATVEVFGQYLGTGAAASRAITALLPGGATLSQNTHPYLQAQLIFAGCLGKTLAQCLPQSEGGTLGRGTFAAGSAYVAKKLTTAQAHSLVQVIDARQAAGRSGVLLLDAQGGAIDDEPAGQTSFVHRDMRSSVQILSYDSPASAQAFVDTARAALARLGNGQAYQNYPDANLKTWRTAYYGAKYADLVTLKRERDPYGLLHFPQAVGS
ncbi:MAG: FAD-dependent oxidoreductase [Actinomycetota bacterium]|nr:FAD-dependent oxidoreductase [Actinomycetota bacterium]